MDNDFRRMIYCDQKDEVVAIMQTTSANILGRCIALLYRNGNSLVGTNCIIVTRDINFCVVAIVLIISHLYSRFAMWNSSVVGFPLGLIICNYLQFNILHQSWYS